MTWIVILGGSHDENPDFAWLGPFDSEDEAKKCAMKLHGRVEELASASEYEKQNA